MTQTEKDARITKLVRQLSAIREDLGAARAERRDGLSRLRAAGDAVKATGAGDPTWDPGQNPALQPKPWPTRDELHELNARIDRLKADAARAVEELRGLGVDGGLFKLNGD